MKKNSGSVDIHPSVIFIGFFVGIYVILYVIYMFVPDSILKGAVYPVAFVEPCVGIINMALPDEQVFASSNRIQSSKASLEIVRGCDGIGSVMLILSAMIAFSTTIKNRLIGVAIGVVVMYSLNLARIIILYFVSAYHVGWFINVHTLIAPTMVIVAGCLCFAWWAMWSSQHDRA